MPAGSQGPCAHAAAGATRGFVQHDDHGAHACSCARGGGVLRCHNSLRDALGGWVARVREVPVLRGQAVPAWGRPDDRAILDLAVPDRDGTMRYVDISVVDPTSRNDALQRRRASQAGSGIRDRERRKHARYPGDALDAFVIGGCGRLGMEAQTFLRVQVQHLEPAERMAEMTSIRQTLSVVLQRAKAELMLSAVRGPRPWQRAEGGGAVASGRA